MNCRAALLRTRNTMSIPQRIGSRYPRQSIINLAKVVCMSPSPAKQNQRSLSQVGRQQFICLHMQIIAEKVLSALRHAAGIGIIWWAGRNWDHADARGNNLVLGRGGRGRGCGGYTGEDESNDESADDGFHGMAPLGEKVLDNLLQIKGLTERRAARTIGLEPCRRHWDRLEGRSELGSC